MKPPQHTHICAWCLFRVVSELEAEEIEMQLQHDRWMYHRSGRTRDLLSSATLLEATTWLEWLEQFAQGRHRNYRTLQRARHRLLRQLDAELRCVGSRSQTTSVPQERKGVRERRCGG